MSKYRISSPSEDRQYQMERLLGLSGGLGAAGYPTTRTVDYKGEKCEIDVPHPAFPGNPGTDSCCESIEGWGAAGCYTGLTTRLLLGTALNEYENSSLAQKLKFVADALDKIGDKNLNTVTVSISGKNYRFKTACVLRFFADKADKLPAGCRKALETATSSVKSTGLKAASDISFNIVKAVVVCIPAAIPVLIKLGGGKCSLDGQPPAQKEPANDTTGDDSTGGDLTNGPTAKSGLSTGAWVGIGVGVTALLGAIAFFALRKK